MKFRISSRSLISGMYKRFEEPGCKSNSYVSISRERKNRECQQSSFDSQMEIAYNRPHLGGPSATRWHKVYQEDDVSEREKRE
jgi:hypothetical protein